MEIYFVKQMVVIYVIFQSVHIMYYQTYLN